VRVVIVKTDLVISVIFLMRTSKHGPRDAVIEKDERNERDHESFWQMAIHNLTFWRAGIMPLVFMVLSRELAGIFLTTGNPGRRLFQICEKTTVNVLSEVTMRFELFKTIAITVAGICVA